MCYIANAFSEQQKINSGFFLFEAEQKAKKANKNIAGKCCMHQPKHHETYVDEQDILVVECIDNSTITDESLNSWEDIFLMFVSFATPAKQLKKYIGEL